MKKILISLFAILAVFVGSVSAQGVKVAAKLNVVPLAVGVVNAGVDIGFANHWVVGVEGYGVVLNPYKDNTKALELYKGWGVDAHMRYYFCENFNGHHIGLYAVGSFIDRMRVDAKWISTLFTGSFNPNNARDVKVIAGGIEYGYHFPLSYRWGLDIYIGGGLIYADYKEANSTTRHNTGLQWSISKGGIAFTYIF